MLTMNIITEFYRAFNSAQNELSRKNEMGINSSKFSKQFHHLAILNFSDFKKEIQHMSL